MILVARDVAIALANYAKQCEETEAQKSARTLPGYETYEKAIEAQYEISEETRKRYADYQRFAGKY